MNYHWPEIQVIYGEQKLISKIKKLNDVYLLVREECLKYNSIGQNPLEAIKYVINNYECIGYINEYSVYYID